MDPGLGNLKKPALFSGQLVRQQQIMSLRLPSRRFRRNRNSEDNIISPKLYTRRLLPSGATAHLLLKLNCIFCWQWIPLLVWDTEGRKVVAIFPRWWGGIVVLEMRWGAMRSDRLCGGTWPKLHGSCTKESIISKSSHSSYHCHFIISTLHSIRDFSPLLFPLPALSTLLIIPCKSSIWDTVK